MFLHTFNFSYYTQYWMCFVPLLSVKKADLCWSYYNFFQPVLKKAHRLSAPHCICTILNSMQEFVEIEYQQALEIRFGVAQKHTQKESLHCPAVICIQKLRDIVGGLLIP